MRSVVLVLLSILTIGTRTVAAEDTFTISTSYQNLLSNAEGKGMLDRILTEAFRRIGFKVEIVYTPTAKSLPDVNAGIMDGEINRIAGMETQFPNLRRISEPNMTMEFVAFSSRPVVINGWESIQGHEIGLVKGWRILEENTKGFPFVATVPTEIELFTMLRKGRIDLALYDKLTGYAVLKELGYESISHLDPPLAQRDMFLYVHRKHEAIMEKIAASLRAMKRDGTYDRIKAEVLKAYGISLD